MCEQEDACMRVFDFDCFELIIVYTFYYFFGLTTYNLKYIGRVHVPS